MVGPQLAVGLPSYPSACDGMLRVPALVPLVGVGLLVEPLVVVLDTSSH